MKLYYMDTDTIGSWATGGGWFIDVASYADDFVDLMRNAEMPLSPHQWAVLILDQEPDLFREIHVVADDDVVSTSGGDGGVPGTVRPGARLLIFEPEGELPAPYNDDIGSYDEACVHPWDYCAAFAREFQLEQYRPVNAYTVVEAAEYLGISRQYAYDLSRQHDPATSKPVLEPYVPEGVVGWEKQQVKLVTAESVERYKRARQS